MNMATKAQKAKDAAKQLSRYHRLMERQKTYKFGPAYEVGTRAWVFRATVTGHSGGS
jgi:hypothetical protein